MPGIGIGISPFFNRVTGGGGFDPDANAWFSANASAGNPVSDIEKPYYNDMYLRWKANGEWANKDSIFVFAVENRNHALRDHKNPSRVGIVGNTYVGDFVPYYGFVGNSALNILTNFNPGDGGTYNYVQDDASIGVLRLINTPSSFKHDVSCNNAGFSAGNLINNSIPFQSHINSGGQNNLSPNWISRNDGWAGVTRDSSATEQVYVNGFKEQDHVQASTVLENKSFGLLDAYNGAFTGNPAFCSDNALGAIYFGDSTVVHNNMINGINVLLSQNGASAISKVSRFSAIGDSMTGDFTFPTLSESSQYLVKTIDTLGGTWQWAQESAANRTMAQIVSIASTRILPNRNTGLVNDVLCVFAGTNDIAFSNGVTGASLKADLDTFILDAKTSGFKVIVVGIPDRQAGFSGGQNQAGFDTERAAYRALMNSAYTVSTSVANTFAPATPSNSLADFWIDISADSRFNDATDTTYFQVDLIHLNSAGYDILGQTYAAPTALLL